MFLLRKNDERQSTAVLLFLAAACLVNILITAYGVHNRFSTRRTNHKSYTYIGLDFPNHFPTDATSELGAISMNFQESTSYPLVRPFSFTDIASFNGANEGMVRLGPSRRAFVVSMFHQMHCMTNFRHAFTAQDHSAGGRHMQHCLRYMRQQFLCKADLTLENYDFMSVNFSSWEEKVHDSRTCQNWEELHNRVEKNYVDWRKYMKEMDLPVTEISSE